MEERYYLFYMLVGFLSGSVLFAYEIPRLMKGVDVRKESKDGNPGTFNAFVCGGIGCGIATLFAELFKGFWPVFLCRRQLGTESLLFAGVLAAPVFGHAFSVFHKGKGGKGIAVSFGVLLGLLPLWRPVFSLVFFYLLFSLVLPIKSHLKRSVVTFLCFSATMLLTMPIPCIRRGCMALSGVVVFKHCEPYLAALPRRKKWRTE